MQKAVTDGLTPEYITDAMKNWGPMSESAMTMWRTMFDQIGTSKK
jgi:hypothetical protein